MQSVGVGPDPGDDRPDRPPRDAHQMRDRTLGRLRGQPGHRLIERHRVARTMPGPRHVRHDNTVLGAGHPRRVGLDHRLHRAQIQRPPAASSFTGVVPPAAALTDSTAPCSGVGPAGPDRPSPGCPRRTRQPPRWSSPHRKGHAIAGALRTRSPLMCSGPSYSPEPMRGTACALNSPRPQPRIGQESHL